MRALRRLRAWAFGCPVCGMPSVLEAAGRPRRHLVFCRYGVRSARNRR
jgi:hypothetical protein